MEQRAKMREASQSWKLLFWHTLQNSGTQSAFVQNALNMLMEIPLADFEGVYRWFEGLPIMRHWIDDRQAADLRAEGFQVKMQPWESTIKVKREDIKYDRLGGYNITIRSMANELQLLRYRQLLALMKDMRDGSTYTCFDGYPLISASHATGTNLGTAALAHASLDDAIAAVRNQADVTNSDDLLIEPTHLWYHKALQSTVEDILDLDFVASLGTSTTHTDTTIRNKHYKRLQPIPMNLGSTRTAWWGLFAADPGGLLGPVLWQYDPSGGKFVSMDKDTDEANFMRRDLLYGTEYWGAVACGFPQYIWGSDGTT